MKLQLKRIFFTLLLIVLPVSSLLAQPATPPPPVPPPPPGLPIDDYVQYMMVIALVIGIFYFVKFKSASKLLDD